MNGSAHDAGRSKRTGCFDHQFHHCLPSRLQRAHDSGSKLFGQPVSFTSMTSLLVLNSYPAHISLTTYCTYCTLYIQYLQYLCIITATQALIRRHHSLPNRDPNNCQTHSCYYDEPNLPTFCSEYIVIHTGISGIFSFVCVASHHRSPYYVAFPMKGDH